MHLFLSKLLPLFIYPLFLSIWLMVAGIALVWMGFKKLSASAIVIALGVLWVCSMPLTADRLLAGLEHRYTPVPVARSPQADAIVVLGGGVGPAVAPRLQLDLANAADRVWHAARLYLAGKAPLVLAVGGSIPWLGPAVPESRATVSLLKTWGVPGRAIIPGGDSRNTYENALEARAIMQRFGIKRVLLVTSALHMPRALAVFRSLGIDAIPSPTDFEVVERGRHTILEWLPEAESLERTTRAIREYLGYSIYRWRGWIKSEDGIK